MLDLGCPLKSLASIADVVQRLQNDLNIHVGLIYQILRSWFYYLLRNYTGVSLVKFVFCTSSYLEEQSFFYKIFLHDDFKENIICKTHNGYKIKWQVLFSFAYVWLSPPGRPKCYNSKDLSSIHPHWQWQQVGSCFSLWVKNELQCNVKGQIHLKNPNMSCQPWNSR